MIAEYIIFFYMSRLGGEGDAGKALNKRILKVPSVVFHPGCSLEEPCFGNFQKKSHLKKIIFSFLFTAFHNRDFLHDLSWEVHHEARDAQYEKQTLATEQNRIERPLLISSFSNFTNCIAPETVNSNHSNYMCNKKIPFFFSFFLK